MKEVLSVIYETHKTRQHRREELFLFVVKLQNILFGCFFCAGEIFTTLVDSTVSENKIHSFSGLSR